MISYWKGDKSVVLEVLEKKKLVDLCWVPIVTMVYDGIDSSILEAVKDFNYIS